MCELKRYKTSNPRIRANPIASLMPFLSLVLVLGVGIVIWQELGTGLESIDNGMNSSVTTAINLVSPFVNTVVPLIIFIFILGAILKIVAGDTF